MNIQKWRFALMVVNTDSAFNGGYFKVRARLAIPHSALKDSNNSNHQAEMLFPDDYPYAPPKFRFLHPIYHPNIYPDGNLCISILHKPGEDLMSGEQASERWSPLQGVESVLRSVLLLLDDPEIHSPANVDAGVLYRDNREAYNKRARDCVAASKRDIPEGFVMPTSFEPAPPPKMENDDDFWAESDEDYDFGGSDSDEEDGDQEMGEFGDGEEEDDAEEEMSEDDEQDDKK